ncbi:hypothetical protein F5X99DRAFT_282493 [Biscogniauxia marginata]|nr:hypothetical protein F5X99DRAFT_282493 [Biscogniauxia marginata]
MNKMPIDVTMTWFVQAFHSNVLPTTVWTIIGWIAFFFKLASLSFAIPIISLIVFDFFLWLWRLNRPPPRDSSQRSKALKTSAQPPSTSFTSSSATKPNADLASSQRRVGYSAQADGR